MRRASIVAATTIVLALAAVSHAQRPAGITPEMIATALPVEGAPLAVPGPYKVESGPAFGSPGHVVYRPADLTPFPAKGHAARDGLGQRRMRDQQHALRRFPDDDRLARLRRHGDGRRAGRHRWPGHGRQPAQGRRLGRSGEQARGVAAERQDRARSGGGHGPVLRRVPVDRAGRRSARGHDRRVQLGRCRETTSPSSPRCTVRCCSSTGTSGTS